MGREIQTHIFKNINKSQKKLVIGIKHKNYTFTKAKAMSNFQTLFASQTHTFNNEPQARHHILHGAIKVPKALIQYPCHYTIIDLTFQIAVSDDAVQDDIIAIA